jgi:soluble lytic murein transglycosylase-like protein
MFSKITSALGSNAQKAVQQSAAGASVVLNATKNYASTVRHAVLILGIFAIGLLILLFVKPEIAEKLQQMSPFAQEYAVNNTAEQAPALANAATPVIATTAAAEVRATHPATVRSASRPRPLQASTATAMQQKWVAYWLAKRYRVAGDAIHMLVSTSYQVAKEIKLDPLLILSVIAIESRFNPLSESPVGAQGLMQVMSKIHQDKFQKHGGIAAALNPVANIKVGSSILKEYVVQGGSVEAGLKKYVGAAAFATDSGYGHKVLTEYRYLQEVATGKKVPAYATARTASRVLPKTVKNDAPTELPSPAIDNMPTHKDNSKDQIASL